MIEATFEAVVPRERSMPIINQERYFDTNGKYEIKSEEGTAMTKVDVEVDIRPAEFNDVNFYDYDGTILYSYSWEEFLEYNQLPPLPTHHEGLVCQEWNYTLDEIIEQGGRCDVGAIYDTEDGNIHLFIDVSYNNMTVRVHYNWATNSTIDWGDGNSENFINTTSAKYIEHIYSNTGKYEIVVSSNVSLQNSISVPCINPHSCIESAYYGATCTLAQGAFAYTSIQKIVLPKNYSLGAHVLANIRRPIHVNIPRTASIGYITLRQGVYSSISIPNTVVEDSQGLAEAKFRTIHIPNSLINLTSNLNLSSLNNISVGKLNSVFTYRDGCIIKDGNKIFTGISSKISEGITDILNSAFYECYSIEKCVFPSTIKSIGVAAFCLASFTLYDFRKSTSIPILQGSNSFLSPKGRIIVPDNLYDEWIAATNWSTYASYIIKASEYVES